MKKTIILTLLTISSLFILSGCGSQNVDTPKQTKPKYSPDMSSAQVEKAMDWRYCEESF